MPDPERTTFEALFARLPKTLDRLAELHRREVEEARSENVQLHSEQIVPSKSACGFLGLSLCNEVTQENGVLSPAVVSEMPVLDVQGPFQPPLSAQARRKVQDMQVEGDSNLRSHARVTVELDTAVQKQRAARKTSILSPAHSPRGEKKSVLSASPRASRKTSILSPVHSPRGQKKSVLSASPRASKELEHASKKQEDDFNRISFAQDRISFAQDEFNHRETVVESEAEERHSVVGALELECEDMQELGRQQTFDGKTSCRSNTKSEAGSRATRSNWMSAQVTDRFGRQTTSFRQFQIRNFWLDHEDFGSMSLIGLMEQERHVDVEELGFETKASATQASIAGLVASFGRSSFLSGLSGPGLSVMERRRASRSLCVLHPESRVRTLWVLLSLLFLLLDLVMVPFDVCFQPQKKQFSDTMDMITMIFWTIDIPLNFCTGVHTMEGVEMRFFYTARIYMSSWFLFDLLLVAPEWLTFAIGEDDFPSGSHVAFFRFLRWARLTRLLRLARVMRVAKMKTLVRRLAFTFHLSKLYVLATQGWVGLSLLLVIIVHLVSCFWYAFGNELDNGWVQSNHFATKDIGHLYVVSVNWSVSRLHGLMSHHRLETTWELLVDAVLVYLSLVTAAFYVGSASVVSLTGMTSKTGELWNMGIDYVRRHGISSELSFRMQKVLEASQYAGPAEIAKEEEKLLRALPASLQNDLQFQARKRVICVNNTFFSDLVIFNRQAVVHICNEAIASEVAVQGEALFSFADACSRMIFIDFGKLIYVLGRRESCYNNASNAEKLKHGAAISEPTLWTIWEHMGCLFVLEESAVLCVNANDFAQVIVQHKGPHMHAVRYAKHFVWNINHHRAPHDLTSFPELTMANIDSDLFQGTEEDHLMFISHYKVESGTEATLMRDLLLPILGEDRSHPANNLQSPIFIDSEDLIDLARLKEHVIGSAALVLLLTPGVLSRPWCLIEIVTAIRNGVPIVPIEVQRPGCSYRYPDEEYYTGILAGRLIDSQGAELLAREGVQLEDVEKAIRQVFLKIAIPFSPHKTKGIREAELRDILKRCNDELTNAMQNSG